MDKSYFSDQQTYEEATNEFQWLIVGDQRRLQQKFIIHDAGKETVEWRDVPSVVESFLSALGTLKSEQGSVEMQREMRDEWERHEP